MADLLRGIDRPVFVVANKVDDPAARRALGASSRLGLGDRGRSSALHGARHRRPARRSSWPCSCRSPTTTASPTRSWPTAAGRPRVLGGHRRPAQRGQVDAVQPAHRRGPLGRPRHAGHDPRHASTPSSRPTTARSASSTPPACAARPDRRGHRVLLVGAGAAGGRRRRRRAARHRRHRGRHPPGPAPGRADRRGRLPDRRAAQQVGAARRRGTTDVDVPGRPAAALPRRVAVLKISALTGKGVQRLLPALAGRDRRRTTGGSRPGRSTRSSAGAQAAQPAPHGARVLYATQGAADPPTFTLFANKTLPAAVPALPRAALRGGVRPRRDARSSCGSRQR